LGILIEKMRREGFELAVSPPEIVKIKDPNNPKRELEPYEEVIVEADLVYAAVIIDKLVNNRKAVLLSQEDTSDGKQVLSFKVPTKGLLGFRSELINDTRGTAMMRS